MECEAWGGEFGLETAHGEGVGCVFGLGGEHQGDEGLEAFVLLLPLFWLEKGVFSGERERERERGQIY